MRYTIDSSILLEYDKYYIVTDEIKLWDILKENLLNGNFIIGKQVEIEIKNKVVNKNNKNDNIHDWIKSNCSQSIVEYGRPTQTVMSDFTAKYPDWVNPHSVRNTADPWVVAHAKSLNIAVLSDEKSHKTRLSNFKTFMVVPTTKIPEICKLENIIHHNFTQFLASQIP